MKIAVRYYTRSGNTEKLARAIAQAVDAEAQSLGFKKVTWIPSGGVISTHSGPGAFGVVGFAKA